MLITYLSQDWIYVEGKDWADLTPEQTKFETWLWIELSIFYSTIVSGAVFTFICSFQPVCISVRSVTLKDKQTDVDFLNANRILVDMFGQIIAPAFTIAVVMRYVYGKVLSDEHKELEPYLNGSFYCIGIQTIFFILGIMMPRGSESRSDCYIRNAPMLLHWALRFALVIIPFVIVCINITAIVYQSMECLLLVILLTESTTIVWYFMTFAEHFDYNYKNC